MKHPFAARFRARIAAAGRAGMAAVVSAALLLQPLPAAAQSAPTIVRDAELEAIIRTISTPIFEAAGLTEESVHTYVVHDKSLNAFVAGGQNVFVHTGLVMAADNVNQLIGVIAHETGHISGGHLARFHEGLKGASAVSILGMILGAAAIAAGGGDAGMAVLMGSQQAAQRLALSYSRTQEASADQAGLKFLEATGQSGRGLVSFFEILGDQELLYTANQDPYVRSHPLTRDRINTLSAMVEASPYRDAPNPPGYDDLFARMKAKMWGYFQPPASTLSRYPVGDNSLYARYARAYAYNKMQEFEKALAEAQALNAEYPDDPYLWELTGFLLFGNGKIRESIPPFRRAVELAPNEPLILTQLSQALLATEDPELNDEAIRHLELANRLDRESPFGWYQLAIAYHRAGNEPMAHLASAERFALIGRRPEAGMQARAALKGLPAGSPNWIRAQDILVTSNLDEDGKPTIK